MVALLDKIGTEKNVSNAQMEVYGIILIIHVFVLIRTGMDMNVSDVKLDKNGIILLFHVHVLVVLFGMDYNVKYVSIHY